MTWGDLPALFLLLGANTHVGSWHRCEVLECPLLRRFQEQTGPSSEKPKPTLLTRLGHKRAVVLIVQQPAHAV